VQELSETLDDEPVDPEFKAMLERRWEEIVSGKVKTVPHEQVMADARAALKKVREERMLSSGGKRRGK
jgi:putative addiction module component (TIGR02574 family)